MTSSPGAGMQRTYLGTGRPASETPSTGARGREAAANRDTAADIAYKLSVRWTLDLGSQAPRSHPLEKTHALRH